MSDRETKEIIETTSGDTTVVTHVTVDENGDEHVGTSSYENDTWHTDSDREAAHKEAADEAYSPYN